MSYNIQVISVKLQRSDNTVSWGFNVQGGKEFHSPLVIQKVNANSLAERSSIRQGDYILRIGNIITENLTHNQARDAIIRQGNNLELTLQRGSPPRAEDYAFKYEFPQHQLMQSGIHHHAPAPHHNYGGSGLENAAALSPQVGLQLAPNRALLTQSYNSPMGLYSNQNIADALATSVKNEKSNNNIKPNNNLYVCTSLSSCSSTGSLTATSSSVSPISFNNNKNYDSNLNNKIKSFTLSNNKSIHDQFKHNDDNNNNRVNLLNNDNSSSITSSLSASPSSLLIQTNLVNATNEKDEEIDNSLNSLDINKYLYRAVPLVIEPEEGKHNENFNKPKVSSFYKYSSSNQNEANLKDELKKQLNLKKQSSSINKLEDSLLKSPTNNALIKQTSSGRLLLKSIEKSILTEDDYVEENKKSFRKNYSDTLLKIDIPQSSQSITSIKSDLQKDIQPEVSQLSYLKKSQYQYPVKKPLSTNSSSHLITKQSHHHHHTVGHVAKLDDPTKPSVTQSRSFKLLQEMLDNGLVEQNAVFYDNIRNKKQLRRCSLNLKNTYPENLDNIPTDLESLDIKINNLNLDEKNKFLSKIENKFLVDYPKPYIKTNKTDSNAKKDTNNNYNEDSNRNRSEAMNINDSSLLREAQNIKQNPSIISCTSLNLRKSQPAAATGSSSLPSPISEIKQGGASVSNYQQFNQQSQHHYQAPPPPPLTSAPIHRPVAPFGNTTTSSVPAPQPYRSSNLSTSLAGGQSTGGQRNITRGLKGSALLTNPNKNASNALPTCGACYQLIRGPFISAVGKIWCPNHFVCAHPSCGSSLMDVGFVEENGKLYCESDFEKYFAPTCYKCKKTVLGECCYALEKAFHPECFVCGHCKQAIGSGSFHLEDGVPYCHRDFNALFSTKCIGCDFPIEAGDKFVEALNQKYHIECFTCSTCHVTLHNIGYATKGNKPYCRKHAY